MTLALRYAALTNDGLVREHNEDSGYAGPHLLAVADGMGGMVYGELASALTIDSLRRLDTPHHTDLLGALNAAAREANSRIAERIGADPRLEGMGTTLTAILFDGTTFGFAHIGDSRGYLLRDETLQQFTTDHTFVQSLVDDGRITKDEARTHPHKNLITRAVQGQPDTEPDLAFLELQAGDRVLLCSDGLTDVASDTQITAALARHQASPEDVGSELIQLALQGGGPDNVTCVVADITDQDAGGPVNAAGAAAAAAAPFLLVGAAADTNPDDLQSPMETTAAQPVVDAAPSYPPEQAEEDLDDGRYAPLPPKRFRWLRRTAVLIVALGLIAAVGWGAYTWTQTQYYVASYPDGTTVEAAALKGQAGAGGSSTGKDGTAAVYRGVPVDLPGINLHNAIDVAAVDLEYLPTYHRQRLAETIPADDQTDAEEILAQLNTSAARCARQANPPQPKPKPTPTKPTPSKPKPSEGERSPDQPGPDEQTERNPDSSPGEDRPGADQTTGAQQNQGDAATAGAKTAAAESGKGPQDEWMECDEPRGGETSPSPTPTPDEPSQSKSPDKPRDTPEETR